MHWHVRRSERDLLICCTGTALNCRVVEVVFLQIRNLLWDAGSLPAVGSRGQDGGSELHGVCRPECVVRELRGSATVMDSFVDKVHSWKGRAWCLHSPLEAQRSAGASS